MSISDSRCIPHLHIRSEKMRERGRKTNEIHGLSHFVTTLPISTPCTKQGSHPCPTDCQAPGPGAKTGQLWRSPNGRCPEIGGCQQEKQQLIYVDLPWCFSGP